MSAEIAFFPTAKPAPEMLKTDQHGRLMAKFLLEYTMDGKKFAADIWAYSIEDAERRVEAMRESLTVVGQLYAVIEA